MNNRGFFVVSLWDVDFLKFVYMIICIDINILLIIGKCGYIVYK